MDGNCRKREHSTDTDNTDISFSNSPSSADQNLSKKEKKRVQKEKKKAKMAELKEVENKEKNDDSNLCMILKSLNDLNRKHDDIVRKLESVATKDDVDSIRNEMDKINKSLTKRIDVLESRVYNLERERDGLTNKVDALKREKGELEDKLSSHEQKMINCERNANDHEQYVRGWNLRFFGFPEEEGEKETVGDCIDKVVKLANERLNVEIDRECIEIAHRTGQNRLPRQRAERVGEHAGASAGGTGAGRGAKHRPIIVRFYSRLLRDELLTKRKVLKGSGISIGEDLTPVNFKLLKRVQEHHTTLSAWTHRGKVLAKLKTGPVVQVYAHSNVDDVLSRGVRGLDSARAPPGQRA